MADKMYSSYVYKGDGAFIPFVCGVGEWWKMTFPYLIQGSIDGDIYRRVVKIQGIASGAEGQSPSQ